MNGTWRGILAGSIGAVALFGLGSLETYNGLSQGARLPSRTWAPADQSPTWQGLLIAQGNLLALELGPPADATAGLGAPRNMTAATPANTQTVLEVDQRGHRLVAVNDVGWIRVAEVSNDAMVVTGDKRTSDLTLVSVGDLVNVEPRDGRVERIVVLRHAATAEQRPAR